MEYKRIPEMSKEDWERVKKTLPEQLAKFNDGTARTNQDGRHPVEFRLNEDGLDKLVAFRAKHQHPDLIHPALGEVETFLVTPTGFGPIWHVKCEFCAQTEDLTTLLLYLRASYP